MMPTLSPATAFPAAPDERPVLDALDDALVALRRAQQRPGYRRRLFAGVSAELELATLRLLRVVQRDEENPTIGRVAELLAIDPSTASRLVDRSVNAELLVRLPCAEDGRRARLRLTAAGETLLEQINDQRRDLLADVTSAWEPNDVRRLVDLLRCLVADFDAVEASV